MIEQGSEIPGQCLCGAVRFRISTPTSYCVHCHCGFCRRAHGAAFVTWFGIPQDQLTFPFGRDHLRWYASSENVRRGFCARCGSTLFHASDLSPGEIRVALAHMKAPIDREPDLHVFFDHRVPWIQVSDGLPRLTSEGPELSAEATAGDECRLPSSTTLLQAAAFAARKHRRQLRKDSEGMPYINHPIAVAQVLASEAGITDEELLVAALLHDTVEDTNTTLDEIQETFGPVVCSLVAEVTDDRTLEKAERKQRQVDKAPHASPRAKQLKIADKICNLRDIATAPPGNWELRHKLGYLEWSRRVVEGCRGVSPALETLYDSAFEDARNCLGIASGRAPAQPSGEEVYGGRRRAARGRKRPPRSSTERNPS